MEEDDFLLVKHGLRTTRFLIEAQMRLLSDLDGAEGALQDNARVSLRRLLDLESALKGQAEKLGRSRGAARFAA